MSLVGRAFGTRKPFIPADEIDALIEGGSVLLLDVRTAKEVEEAGTIPGAVHIHLGELARRLDEVPRDRPVLPT